MTYCSAHHLFLLSLIATVLPLSVSAVQVDCFVSGDQCEEEGPSSNTTLDECCSAANAFYRTSPAGALCCDCNGVLRIEFTSSAYSVSEGDSVVILTIQRCGGFEEELLLSLTFADGTAEGGIDYAPFPVSELQLFTELLANTSETVFGMNIREDEILEDPETFHVSLRLVDENFNPFGDGGGGGGNSDPISETTVVIEDNDFVMVTIFPLEFEVGESDVMNTRNFSVELNGTSVRNVSLILTTVSNISTGDTDYVTLNQPLTFPPGETRLEVFFIVLDDQVVEPAELVQLVLMAAPGERGVQFPLGGEVTGIILDDNDMVQISFDRATYSAEERSATASLTLRKEGANERDVAVVLLVNNTNNNVATEGTDFNLTISSRTLTFSPGDVTLDFVFAVYQEGVYEPAMEEIVFFLEPAEGETGVEIVGATGRVLILDSDVVSVGFGAERYTAVESTGAVSGSIVLLEGILDSTVVTVEISLVNNPRDLAEEEADFLLNTTTFTFVPEGPRELPFEITLVDDSFFEGREDFTLRLQTSQQRVLLAANTAIISIVDNEDLDVRFQNGTYRVDEAQSVLEVEVTLMSDIEREITLLLTTADGRATAGTDNDYNPIRQTLTFTPSSSSNQVRVDLFEDLASEGLEEFFLRIVLVNEQLGVPGTVTEATVFIFDNENIFISFVNTSLSVGEGEGAAFLTITKSGETQDDIDILLSIRDGTALGGIDYGPFPTPSLDLTLTIFSDETEVEFGVVLRDDIVVERVENFSVTLMVPPVEEGGLRRNVFIKGDPVALVSILDNDVINVTIVPDSLEVSEEQGNVSFEIFRLDNALIDSSLTLTLLATTQPDSALGELDYEEESLTLTFEGDSSANFFVFNASILEDEIVETVETFRIELSVPDEISQHVVFHTGQALLQIMDNDVVSVSLETPLYEVVESSAVASICLRKDSETAISLPVIAQPRETTPTSPNVFQAKANSDFDPSPIATSFPPGDREMCVDVPIVNDMAAGESREVFVVSFTIPTTTGLAVDTTGLTSAVVMINDIPDINFGFTSTSVERSESVGSVDVCVAIFNPSPDDVINTTLSVQLKAVPITTDSSDFVLSMEARTLTLNNTMRQSCVELGLIDDDLFENVAETLNLTIANFTLDDASLVGFASIATATVVVLDDDRFVVVGFDEDSTFVSVGEGAGSVDLCMGVLSPDLAVVAPASFASTISIAVETRPGSAGTEDFDPISFQRQDLLLELDAGNTVACFRVNITDDNLFEGPASSPETFGVQLTPLTRFTDDLRGVSVEPAMATVAIVDDDDVLLVGFEGEGLVREVNESVGMVEVCVGFLEGPPPPGGIGIEFGLRVVLNDDETTADLQLDFFLEQNLILTFNDSRRQQCFDVLVIDDELPEGDVPEAISLDLFLEVGSPLGVAVSANASSTLIHLLDDDDVIPPPTTTMILATTSLTEATPTTIEATPTTTVGATPPTTVEATPTLPAATTTVEATPTTVEATPTSALPTPTPTPIILANDTVLGEPLFSVPLTFDPEALALLPRPGGRGQSSGVPHLCFQLHGDADTHFNLLSDTCTSVNALYSAETPPPSDYPIGFHAVSSVGISAVDATGRCVFLQVAAVAAAESNDCLTVVRSDQDGDGELVSLEVTSRYSLSGVSVLKRRGRVRVSVPNCGRQRLVMHMVCSGGGSGGNVPMMRFDITRGVNLSPTSHGLIGQFWNVPVTAEPYEYTGPPTYLDTTSLYAICVSPPSSPTRKFIAEYYTRKWDLSRDACLYSGNLQGGRLYEIRDPNFNDPVIEGLYTDYIVEGLFKNSFKYSQFARCDMP